jgi:hypothetical protein
MDFTSEGATAEPPAPAPRVLVAAMRRLAGEDS